LDKISLPYLTLKSKRHIPILNSKAINRRTLVIISAVVEVVVGIILEAAEVVEVEVTMNMDSSTID
jgi:hypothetical protein